MSSWWDAVAVGWGAQPADAELGDTTFNAFIPAWAPYVSAPAAPAVSPGAYRVETRGPGYEILSPIATKVAAMFGSEASTRSDLDRAGMIYSPDTDGYAFGGYYTQSAPLTAYNPDLGFLTNAPAAPLNWNLFRIPPMFNIGAAPKTAAAPGAGGPGAFVLLRPRAASPAAPGAPGVLGTLADFGERMALGTLRVAGEGIGTGVGDFLRRVLPGPDPYAPGVQNTTHFFYEDYHDPMTAQTNYQLLGKNLYRWGEGEGW